MTRDDALTIVGAICSHWPAQHWTEQSIDAYATAIEPLDAEITTRALIRCVNELEFYPKVSVLREYVRIERRTADYDGALREAAVETQRMSGAPAPKYECPDWVRGWLVARVKHGDGRVWPQQDPGSLSAEPMPTVEQQRYIEEAGEVSVDMILRAVGAKAGTA